MGQNAMSGMISSSGDAGSAAVVKARECEENDEVEIRGKGVGDRAAVASGTVTGQGENDREGSSEVLTGDFGGSDDGLLSATSVRQNKRPFRVLSPQSTEGIQGVSKGMEQLVMSEISGGNSDARVGAADQGGEFRQLDESGRVLGFRGENADGEAVAAGDVVAGQVEGGSGKGSEALAMRQLSSPEGVREEFESMELQVMGGIFGGSSDARVGAADQGGDIGELDGSGRALGFRDENASDEAAAAGDRAAGQVFLDDGDSGGGGMEAMGIPDRSTMSRTQRKNFKRAAKRIQGRK